MKLISIRNELLTIFSIVICLNVFSQNITTSKGEIIKDRQFLRDKNEITTSDNLGNFVSIRPYRNNGALHNYFVEFFNNLSFTNRIEIETQNKSEILDVFIIKQKVHVFIVERTDINTSLRLDIIDIKSNIKTQKILLEADKGKSPELYEALKNDSNISIEHSSQIVLTIPVIKNKIKYAFVTVFSSELDKLSQYNIYPDKSLYSKRTNFLNTSQYNNKIYVLFNLVYSKDKKVYKLIELNDENQKNIDIPIKADIHELIYSKISGSQFVISGLYSRKKKGGFLGLTYYRIDLESFTISLQRQSRFRNEKANNYFNGLFRKNRSIDIKDLLIDDNLNAYVIGQFYIIRKQQIPIGIPIATIGSAILITYNPISIKYKTYDDILITKINSKGFLEWDKVLPLEETEKITSKSNKRDSSIFTFLSNEQVHILMNGFINKKRSPIEIKQNRRFSKTNFYDVMINASGFIYPKTIFPNKNSEIIFRAGNTVKSDGDLYILGQGNMRKQLVKLKI